MTLVTVFSTVSLLVGTLHGQVMRGPTTPVCIVGTPCEEPAAHVRLYFTRSGHTASTVTDAKGYYRIRLRAGYYAVRTNLLRFGSTPEPRTVRVIAGRNRRVDFDIDTGIR